MSIVSEYKFLVDENLPPDLAEELRSQGLDAFHVNEARKTDRRVSDDMIRRFTLYNKVVVITADDDFVKSYFDRHVPEKLVFVFGLQGKEGMMAAFEGQLRQIITLLESENLVQVGPDGAKIP